VVLLCGVAGSGKTTHTLTLAAASYERLSIDEEVWARFGRYGIDYHPDTYAQLSDLTEDVLRQRLLTLITQGSDVVVDFRFWRRRDRDRCKQLVEAAGGRWRLLYLQVAPEVLRRRLDERNRRFDANAAFVIDEAMLARYLGSFETPDGEGEEVITTAASEHGSRASRSASIPETATTCEGVSLILPGTVAAAPTEQQET
jgi:predicted kinase